MEVSVIKLENLDSTEVLSPVKSMSEFQSPKSVIESKDIVSENTIDSRDYMVLPSTNDTNNTENELINSVQLIEKIEDYPSDNSTLSTALPPREYLLDHSSKSNRNEEFKSKSRNSIHYLDRLAFLLNSIDSVLERLKVLVRDTCSTTSISESNHEPKEIQNNTVISNDGIVLSSNFSTLLGASDGLQSKLLVLHPDKLSNEFSRCSSVVESITELFFLMKNDSYADLDVNSLISNENIKGEDINLKLEDDIKPSSTKRKLKRTKKQCDKVHAKKQGRHCDSEEKISDLEDNNDMTGLNEISSESNISQEQYLSIVKNGKPYTCPSCQKSFNNIRSFGTHVQNKCAGESIEHLKAKWKKENNMFTCLVPGCGKAWKRKETLYSHHQKEHLQGITCPFKCDQCDKTFYMRGLLNNHIKEEHQTTFCELCGKGVKGKLKLHMMRHTGDKPHKCQYCDYSAISSGQVKNHTILVHENHKLPLHFCDICGKDFKLKGHLKEHILTHSDKRTYLCKICGKYLKNPNSYRRHMVSVHKVSHG